MSLYEETIEDKILLNWNEKDCFSEYSNMRLATKKDAVKFEDKKFMPDIVATDCENNTVYFEVIKGSMLNGNQKKIRSISRSNIIKETHIKLIIITDDKYFSSVGHYTISLDLALYGVGIIRKTCKELNISVPELADKIGVGTQTLRNATSTGKISTQIEKSIDLLMENKKLADELKLFNDLKVILNHINKTQ